MQVLDARFRGVQLCSSLAGLPKLPKVDKACACKELCSFSMSHIGSAEQGTDLLVVSLRNGDQDKVGRSANDNTAAIQRQKSCRRTWC